MKKIVVRCCYCRRRYDVSGCMPGARLRCGGCQRIMTVPKFAVSGRPASPDWLKPAVLSVAGGFLVALGVFVAITQLHHKQPAKVPAVSSSPVAPVEKSQAVGGKSGDAFVSNLSVWEKSVHDLKRKIGRTFENQFDFYARRPFLIALEKGAAYDDLTAMQEYHHMIRSVYDHVLGRFQHDPGLKPLTDEVLTLIVLKSEESWEAHMHRDGQTLSNEYIQGRYHADDQWAVTYSSRSRDRDYNRAIHEMVHHIFDAYMAQNSRMSSKPAWMGDGLATYFEYYKVDPRTGGLIFEQNDPRDHPRFRDLQNGLNRGFELIPLSEFVSIGGKEFTKKYLTSRESLESKRTHFFYAQAYVLIHFLRNNPYYGTKFTKYLKKYLDGEVRSGTAEPFIQAFMTPLSDVEQEFRKFLRDDLGINNIK